MRKGIFITVVLAIVFLTGCEVIGVDPGTDLGGVIGGDVGDTDVVDYVFDPPAWIIGTWDEPGDPGPDGDRWIFTATTVTWSNFGNPIKYGEANTSAAVISGETHTATKYEFIWSVIYPQVFEKIDESTIYFNDTLTYKKVP